MAEVPLEVAQQIAREMLDGDKKAAEETPPRDEAKRDDKGRD